MFKLIARPALQEFLKGFNATVFAYGQSGSGKTFTMLGSHDLIDRIKNSELLERSQQVQFGIIPRVVFDLFRHLES